MGRRHQPHLRGGELLMPTIQAGAAPHPLSARSSPTRPAGSTSATATASIGSGAATPGGKPVVFLHGGPGAGCSPDHRRQFDPDALRHPAVRPARLRPLDARTPPRGEHHLAPGRGHRAAARDGRASSAGWCSAAPGARRSRSLTPRPIPSASPSWCCAASSLFRQTELDWLYRYGASRSSPTNGRSSSRRSPRPSAATWSPPITAA